MASITEASFKVLADSVSGVVQELNRLAHMAVHEYEPQVQAAIMADERDPARLEQLLDGMLDFCFDDDILRLYKALCRHYYRFEPAAAVYYVHSYRETWDCDATA
jgi:hypothetical protein